MSKIELKNLTKIYGKTKALDNVSLTFEENKIYGLLGRNGAGKSTMLDIISNRIFPTSGEADLDGENISENAKALSKIYSMSDKTLYPPAMRIKEAIKITAGYYPNFNIEYAMGLAKLFELDINKKISRLSTGYSSIYKIILALSCNAEVVMFDEPVLGLDANHRSLFNKELLKHYSEAPSTLIISTHLIEEAADIIEKVVIIKNGKVVMDDDTETILSKGYSVSGASSVVDEFTKGKEVLGADVLGGLKTAYILGKCEKSEVPDSLELSKIDLQTLFIQLTNV
ncbi:MAG: ABC transporter ATP-binding protein [Oscillospiraceae bacterium]